MQRKSLALRLVKNLVLLLTFIGPKISPKMSMKLSDNFELALQTLAQKQYFLMRPTVTLVLKKLVWSR